MLVFWILSRQENDFFCFLMSKIICWLIFISVKTIHKLHVMMTVFFLNCIFDLFKTKMYEKIRFDNSIRQKFSFRKNIYLSKLFSILCIFHCEIILEKQKTCRH